jgi:hypothetical protein
MILRFTKSTTLVVWTVKSPRHVRMTESRIVSGYQSITERSWISLRHLIPSFTWSNGCPPGHSPATIPWRLHSSLRICRFLLFDGSTLSVLPSSLSIRPTQVRPITFANFARFSSHWTGTSNQLLTGRRVMDGRLFRKAMFSGRTEGTHRRSFHSTDGTLLDLSSVLSHHLGSCLQYFLYQLSLRRGRISYVDIIVSQPFYKIDLISWTLRSGDTTRDNISAKYNDRYSFRYLQLDSTLGIHSIRLPVFMPSYQQNFIRLNVVSPNHACSGLLISSFHVITYRIPKLPLRELLKPVQTYDYIVGKER